MTGALVEIGIGLAIAVLGAFGVYRVLSAPGAFRAFDRDRRE